MREIHLNHHTFNLSNPYEIKLKISEIDIKSWYFGTEKVLHYYLHFIMTAVFFLLLVLIIISIRNKKNRNKQEEGVKPVRHIPTRRARSPVQTKRRSPRRQRAPMRSHSHSDIPPADY